MMTTTTLGSVLARARARLCLAGIDNAGLEARLIIGDALALPAAVVFCHPERPVGSSADARITAMVERRVTREPLAYILGRREFWSLDFRVSPATLIPRPESETLIEAALAGITDRTAPLAVLDLGTGSGCLLLALLSELPHASGLGIDRSAAALAIARANAVALNLDGRARFAAADWGEGVSGRFDLILCNPPYIATADLPDLPADVRCFEPSLALDGGDDGMAAFRRIVQHTTHLLAPKARIFLEIAPSQAAAVGELLLSHGMQHIETRKDLSGRWRCVSGTWQNAPEDKKTLGNQVLPD
jgi:release factor glutamine methyltransferase